MALTYYTLHTARLYADEDISADSESQYERDLSAMRARAQAIIAANASPRTLGGATLPPPPPTTRPSPFVPTTQAPGSLWNDSGVRVRLRTVAGDAPTSSALDRQAALVRALDAAARTSGRDRNAGGAGPRPRGQQQPSEAERWGSPMPFYPSALPLPLVEDVGSLQARSRVFGSAEKIACMPRKRAVSQVGR